MLTTECYEFTGTTEKIFIVTSLVIPLALLIGFGNYLDMLKNKDLWQSLKNNAVYFFGHLLFIPVKLMFAVLLTSKLRAAKFYKTMVFMPYIINGVAISYAFSYFFSPINGAFDEILTVLHMETFIRNWLSDPKIVNFVLAGVSLWRFSGYHVILFMAALQSLPQEVQEAARVDGANAWQMFKYIQIPAIMIMIVVIYIVQNKIIHGVVLRGGKK